MEIRKGQIWQATRSDMQILIHSRVGHHRWKAKKLTNRTGVYNGTHTLSDRTILKEFTLLQ